MHAQSSFVEKNGESAHMPLKSLPTQKLSQQRANSRVQNTTRIQKSQPILDQNINIKRPPGKKFTSQFATANGNKNAAQGKLSQGANGSAVTESKNPFDPAQDQQVSNFEPDFNAIPNSRRRVTMGQKPSSFKNSQVNRSQVMTNSNKNSVANSKQSSPARSRVSLPSESKNQFKNRISAGHKSNASGTKLEKSKFLSKNLHS